MSDERPSTAAAPRVAADLNGRHPGSTLAGLIDVLDRAEGARPRRLPPRHAAAARAAAHRPGSARTVPLRSVRPAPPARPAPAPFRAIPPIRPMPAGPADRSGCFAPADAPGPLSRLTRRVALWGAGQDGEHLAWRGSATTPSVASSGTAAVGLLRSLFRRAALWGAGPHGARLAWSGPACPRPVSPTARVSPTAGASLRDVDGPVLLRALPSTPTIQPAAPSPAAALVPGPAPSPAEPVAPPAPIGHRPPAPPVAASESAGPRVPVQSARTPQPTGWPQRPPRSSHRPARSFPTATGLARARDDPSPIRARGSPRPPPCTAPRAPT
jgi:hypothetical protein